MADLNDKQAAQTIKLTGSDLGGIETNFAAVDQYGNVQVNLTRDQTSDILGVGVGGKRNNQVEVSFATAFDANVVTNTQSGGGNATIANGHALYSTGTAATSSSVGVSVKSVIYRPAHEQYAFFTAAFTTPTSAASVQRIGLFNATNGFFVGYEGLTFGLTKRTAGVNTFVSRASFNVDTLTGASTSKFTRNGVPEALDLTKSNLFRIRFAWLGSANILFETFSPDGEWVLFHNIRQPNLELNPSVTSPNLPVQVEVRKTGADSTVLTVATACWGAGTTSDLAPITETITDETLAVLNRAVITGRASTGGGTYYNVKVTPSGSLITAIGDVSGIVGQKPMTGSVPVVVASDQSPVDAGVVLGDQYVPTTPDEGITQTKLLTDPDNQLKIRGDVLTDEGTFRDDFSGVALDPDYITATSGTGSVSVANSFVTLSTGTASGAAARIFYPGDYGPISVRFQVSVSQRLAAQETVIGFFDDVDAPTASAYLKFVGTSANVVQCITQFSDDPADTQATTVTFFNGTLSSQDNEFYIEVQPEKVSFLLNQQSIAQHRRHIPRPYDVLNFAAKIMNNAAATNTDVAIDYIFLINQNTLQVVNSFDGDSLPIRQKTGYIPTYATAVTNFTYAANGTDIFTITGSDTKVCRIKHISVDGNAQATVTRTVSLLRRSSPNIGGVSVILPGIPFDSSNAPSTAVVRYYTANPTTLGTLVGTMHNEKLVIAAAGANTIEDKLEFGTIDATTMQDITLRSSQELIALNLNGVTTTNNSMNIDILWTEE